MWCRKKKVKKTEKQRARDRADEWFSKYIRIRDSLGNGFGSCFTCGRIREIKEMDAGHYVKRDKKATRYNEINVQLQCKYCNWHRDGEQSKFGVNLDKKYGNGTAEQLMLLGSSPQYNTDYRAISDEYRKKFKKEKETKLWEVK